MRSPMVFLLVVCSFFFCACGHEKEQANPREIESVDATAVNDSSKPIVPQVIEVITEHDRALFQKAVDGAIRIDGTVNMAGPHYKIMDRDENYHLWVNKDGSATLMNTKDTHTIYEIYAGSGLNEIDKLNPKQ